MKSLRSLYAGMVAIGLMSTAVWSPVNGFTSGWGSDKNGNIMARENSANSWISIPGTLTQISAGKNGLLVIGLNVYLAANGILATYYRTGISDGTRLGTAWSFVSGAPNFAQVAVEPNSSGRVWALTTSNILYSATTFTVRTPNTTANWTVFNPTSSTSKGVLTFNQISAGGSGQLWAVNSSGLYYNERPSTSKNFIVVQPPTSGAVKMVSVGGNNQVWIIDSAYNIWYRTGITPTNLYGNGWSQIEGNFVQVYVNPDGEVTAVNSAGSFARQGVTASNPAGSSWAYVGKAMNYAPYRWPTDAELSAQNNASVSQANATLASATAAASNATSAVYPAMSSGAAATAAVKIAQASKLGIDIDSAIVAANRAKADADTLANLAATAQSYAANAQKFSIIAYGTASSGALSAANAAGRAAFNASTLSTQAISNVNAANAIVRR